VCRKRSGYSDADLMLNVDELTEEIIKKRKDIKVQEKNGKENKPSVEEEDDYEGPTSERVKMTAERACHTIGHAG
jgi:hypothetical protein